MTERTPGGEARPLVSVCMPSYNYARYLPGAIESVLSQTYRELELVVVDDGSTDGSLDVAHEAARSDDRVRVLTHEGGGNHGTGPTLNVALAAARGSLVSHLGADDVLFPDALERLVAALERDAGAGLAYGHSEVLDPDGLRTGRIGGLDVAAVCAFDRTSDPLQALLLHDFLPAPTVLARRELVEDAGLFDTDVYYLDWVLWVRLLARGHAVFVSGAPLVGARLHAHGLDPRDGERDLPRRLEVFRLLDREGASLGGRFAQEPRLRALVRLQRAAHAELLGRHDEAERSLLGAFEADAALADDVDYLFWWLGWLQQRRVGLGDRRSAPGWPAPPERRGVAGALAARAATGETAFGALVAARPALSPGVLTEVAWGLLGNELEREPTARRRVEALGLALRSLAADPRSARSRRLGKLLLCACGIWSPALRTRAVLARGG